MFEPDEDVLPGILPELMETIEEQKLELDKFESEIRSDRLP
jgi:hypothetical protein